MVDLETQYIQKEATISPKEEAETASEYTNSDSPNPGQKSVAFCISNSIDTIE